MTENPDLVPQESSSDNNLLAQIFRRQKPSKPPQVTKTEEIPSQSQPAGPQKWWQKPAVRKRLSIGLGVFVALLVILGTYTAVVANKLKAQAQELATHAQAALNLFKTQNLPGAEQELLAAQESLVNVEKTYRQLVVYNFIPFARGYYQDGQHALNAAESGLAAAVKGTQEITPYSDVLGFEGEGSFSGGTAEDRIQIILETLEKVLPAFDEIAADLENLRAEVLAINPYRYPASFRGMEVRKQLVDAQATVDEGVTGFLNFRPVLEQLPEISGGKGERKKYLILFQNDNELRPTGGFLTAYAVVYIENGKVTPEKSDDIYELDQRFNKRIAIPESLGKYLTTERYWNLRDMNINPDFKLSMKQFFEHYQEVPGEPDDIDGIIAVDTEVLTDLLAILGPVSAGGAGTFSAEPDNRCDGCAQVVYALSEIITKPTPYHREDRKGILGPLMQATLQKAYSAPKELWPDLFASMWKNVAGRHIQLYFLDESAQMAAEAIGGAGRLTPPKENVDFLAIVDANLGGAKSNLYTSYEVEQSIQQPTNGYLEKTVEITYENTKRADNCNLEAGQLCLNSTLQDWARLYVPQGSTLVDVQGFTNEPTVYEENGFTVIDGFFTLEPLATAKLRVTYQVPYNDSEIYRGFIWKQGGVEAFPVLFDVNGWEEEIEVAADTEVEIPF